MIRTRLVILGTVLSFAAALAGCPCDPPAIGLRQQSWDFESTSCTDPLCGFTVEAGTAQQVTAFTAGEHALELGGESRASASMSVPLIGASASTQVSLLARCDEGTTLELTETVSETFGTGTDAPSIVTQSSPVSATAEWSRVATSFASPSSASGGATPTSTTVVQFAMQTHGPGSCTVDDIAITTFSGGFCD